MWPIVGLAILVAGASAVLMVALHRIMRMRSRPHWTVREIRGYVLRALGKNMTGMTKLDLWHLLREGSPQKVIEMVQFLAVFTELFEEGLVKVRDDSGQTPRYVLSESLRMDTFALDCEALREKPAGH